MADTAVIQQTGNCWVGWIEELPGVNGQEGSREQLLSTLKITLVEALDLNRADARASAGSDYQEEIIAV